jgi:hypothetical protein
MTDIKIREAGEITEHLLSLDYLKLTRQFLTKFQTDLPSIWEVVIDQNDENKSQEDKLQENNYRSYDLIDKKIKKLKRFAQKERIPLTLFAYYGDNKNGGLTPLYV